MRFLLYPPNSEDRHFRLEPTPSPSQEGSGASWIVPLLGGVRGGWVGGGIMGGYRLRELRSDMMLV